MPLYNKEREVERAIRSVFAQTFNDYELIVVNDGSTDKGPEMVSKINDPRIRIIHQQNGGVSAARNRGIEEARSDLIAFLDADDEWLPNFLETVNRLQSHFPTCWVFATNYLYRNVDGSLMPTIIRGMPAAEWEGILENYFKVASQSDPPVCSSAVVIRKRAIKSVGGFPTGVAAGEDILTWAKLVSKYKIAYSTQASAIFYLRQSLWGYPTRPPDSVDTVGQELERILNNGAKGKITGLEDYIAHWHQMRASVFLRLGKRRDAISEVKKIAKYSKRNSRIYLFFAMALLPQKIFAWVQRAGNYLKYHYRKRIR
jgi:glycosyltransferase involved in cell wall biosynthesis